MCFEEFASRVNLIAAQRVLVEPLWERAQETNAPIFDCDFYHKWYPLTGASKSLYPRMDEVSRVVASDALLRKLGDIIYYGAFLKSGEAAEFTLFSYVKDVLGENEGIFYLMIALGALPLTEDKFRELNIPVSYAHAIADWLKGTIAIYEAGHDGIPGFNLSQLPWMQFYVKGRLFRIGRLEFLTHSYEHQSRPAVYRNKKDGGLTLFCREGWSFTASGDMVSPPTDETITTHLSVGVSSVTGTPIARDGSVSPGEVMTLSTEEWEPLASAWDMVPSLHIPGGGGMTPEKVRASIKEACEFFRTYFKQEIKFFFCQSWILNPGWKDVIPESNIVKFREEGHCFPQTIRKGAKDGLFFIYGRDDVNPLEVEPKNKMQAAFKSLFERGMPLRTGGIVIVAP